MKKTAVKGANVSVEYIDEATNESIAPTETLSGKIGATFQAEVKRTRRLRIKPSAIKSIRNIHRPTTIRYFQI